jgi:parallel beta-helix repeat protein
MQRKISILIIALIFFLAFSAHFSWGASYDLYVDKNYSGDEEGTSEKPYKKISDALKKADDGDKIYIKNGTYEEEIVLESGVEVYGQEKSKTIIKGKSGLTVKGKGNNKLKNLTITGGYSGVTFEKKGEVENCLIKNATKNAIDAVIGSSELKVTDSKITGNGKGIYVQMGRVIMISNNEFLDNGEEGIDIREKVKGVVQGNIITGNGEGGIEIVIGSANVTIKNNKINKNKASGIAAQFYSQAAKTGQIIIQKNTINQNGHFGIVCNAPSGGDTPKNYWNNSIDLTENTIENNKKKAISGTCKIAEAITQEEENKNQIIEQPVTENNAAIGEESDATEELKPEDIYNQFELSFLKEIKSFTLQKEEFLALTIQFQNEAEKRSKIKIFFIGSEYKKINALEQLHEQQKNNLQKMRDFRSSDDNDLLSEIIDPLANEIENQIKNSEEIISLQKNKFSLFGWLIKIFNK